MTIWRGPLPSESQACQAPGSEGMPSETAGEMPEIERLTLELAHQRRLFAEQSAALAHSRKIFERAAAAAKIGVWECDLVSDDSLTWTDGVYDLFELPRGSKIDRAATVKLYAPESRVEMERLRSKAIRECGSFTMDARIVTTSGKERWMRLTGEVESENGVAVRLFGMKQDITEEKALLERTRFLAETDLMTGLANRSAFQDILFGDAAFPVEDVRRAALLLIDLDGFKQVNDTFGHVVGDECLKQIATRLKGVCADARLVARIGGDEFAVLMNPPTDQAAAETVADAIITQMRRPILLGGGAFQIGASVGIAVAQASGADSAAELFAHADAALYAAKAQGKNTFRVFDPLMKIEGRRRFQRVRDIERAIADDQLDLHYQPKFRLSDMSVYGFEALLRRHTANGRTLNAGTFMSALEDPGLAVHIGKFVLDKALRQAARWQQDGVPFGTVAINLSSPQIHSYRFAEKLIDQVLEHGLKPECIEVEVTEGVFLGGEPGPVKRILERLKKTGIRVALDDFGTGYASLVHLSSYPIDVIKIDRTFVRRLLASPHDHAIIEAVLRLGSSLGMDVVAEGIETEAERAALTALGCEHGQGFLCSPAVPARDVGQWFTGRQEGQSRVA